MNELEEIRNWYEALRRADFAAVFERFSPDIEWREAEGHPYAAGGQAWRGPHAVRNNLFARLATEWEDFSVAATDFHHSGATVIAEGRYTGTFKATGKRLDAQFCHVWEIQASRIVSFRQYVDTAQLLRVTAVADPCASPWAQLLQQL